MKTRFKLLLRLLRGDIDLQKKILMIFCTRPCREGYRQEIVQKDAPVEFKVDPVERTKDVKQEVKINIEDGIKTKTFTEVETEKTAIKDEPVDWLARFRQAAEKYKTQEVTSTEIQDVKPRVSAPVWEEPQAEKKAEKVEESIEESEFSYYRSGVGGLKEIAQSLDKSAKNASLDYAFTMQAGLSLHKPIKPFSLIHSYIRSRDKAYFEKVLQLTPSTKDNAQLSLITSNDTALYADRREMHGLQVVSDQQLKLDLLNEGETDLANELE